MVMDDLFPPPVCKWCFAVLPRDQEQRVAHAVWHRLHRLHGATCATHQPHQDEPACDCGVDA